MSKVNEVKVPSVHEVVIEELLIAVRALLPIAESFSLRGAFSDEVRVAHEAVGRAKALGFK